MYPLLLSVRTVGEIISTFKGVIGPTLYGYLSAQEAEEKMDRLCTLMNLIH